MWLFAAAKILIIWRFSFRKLRKRSTMTTVSIPKISHFFNFSISNNNYAVRCAQLFQRYQVQCTSDGWPCGTKPKAGSNTPCIETHRQARSVKIDTFGWVPSRGAAQPPHLRVSSYIDRQGLIPLTGYQAGGAAQPPHLRVSSYIDRQGLIPLTGYQAGGRRSRHTCGYPAILTVRSQPRGPAWGRREAPVPGW